MENPQVCITLLSELPVSVLSTFSRYTPIAMKSTLSCATKFPTFRGHNEVNCNYKVLSFL